MKTIAYLTLVGGLALACAGPAFAGPIGDDDAAAGASESFTPPSAPPSLGLEVSNYINSLPPDAGDAGTGLSYDTSLYTPKSTDGLPDLQISWNDIVGVTTGAYDQYWLTHTSPPPQPLFQPLFFSAPTGQSGRERCGRRRLHVQRDRPQHQVRPARTRTGPLAAARHRHRGARAGPSARAVESSATRPSPNRDSGKLPTRG